MLGMSPEAGWQGPRSAAGGHLALRWEGEWRKQGGNRLTCGLRMDVEQSNPSVRVRCCLPVCWKRKFWFSDIPGFCWWRRVCEPSEKIWDDRYYSAVYLGMYHIDCMQINVLKALFYFSFLPWKIKQRLEFPRRHNGIGSVLGAVGMWVRSPAQWVRNLALPQLRLRSWLWLRSDPWPGSSMCHRVAKNDPPPQKKTQKLKKLMWDHTFSIHIVQHKVKKEASKCKSSLKVSWIKIRVAWKIPNFTGCAVIYLKYHRGGDSMWLYLQLTKFSF